jgi:hypothetical protein
MDRSAKGYSKCRSLFKKTRKSLLHRILKSFNEGIWKSRSIITPCQLPYKLIESLRSTGPGFRR